VGIKLKNLYAGLKDQLPMSRLFRNLFITGNAKGLFHIRSHQRDDGKEKVMYNTRATAIKASESMGKKFGTYYSVYKCIFCDGYHIGRNQDNKPDGSTIKG
jgi:hypothetical protein